MTSPIEKQSFGVNGSVVVGPESSLPAGAYCAIQFVTSGVLTSLTSNSITGAVGVAFTGGFVLYGPFTALTTGVTTTVVAYRSSM